MIEMYEFFSMVWRYVLEHSTAFITFITSSGFLSAFISVILTVKTRKSAKENTAATRELKALMEQNKALADIVRALEKGHNVLNEKVEETLETADRILTKTNAVLEVEYIKNGATSNAKTRTDVNNVINNAKYSETATRASLIAKLEEMESNAAKLQETVNKTANEVKKTLTAEDKPAVMRG
jgi:hypothetical protein